MLFGILLMTTDGLQAGMAHMLFHGTIKMSLFLCAGAFIHKADKNYIYELNGVGKKMPWTFLFYTLGAMSLSGIPLFAGFVSKWSLLMAGTSSGTALGLIGAICLLAASFLCAIYTLTVSVRAFFPAKETDRWSGTSLTDPGWRMLLPIFLFTVLDVVFGVLPGPIMGFLGQIAKGVI
jgi:multicomponent Na+:H+ antiporter subunit D